MDSTYFKIEENRWDGKVLTKYTGSDRVVTIPDGVCQIGALAFENADLIDTVIIPDSVTVIEFAAFRNSSISYIVIPQKVNRIGECAFEGCKSLKHIEIQNPDIKFSKSPFKDAASDFEIIFGGTCERFKAEAENAYLGQGEYQSGDYHHPTATHFEYYKYDIYGHIFSETLDTPFTCRVKCTDGELEFHEMPRAERTVRK